MPSDDAAGNSMPEDVPEPLPDAPLDPARPEHPSETPGDPAAPASPPEVPGAPGDPDPSNAVPFGAAASEVREGFEPAEGSYPAEDSGPDLAGPTRAELPEPVLPADATEASGPVTEEAVRLAEGLIFASAAPVPAARLATLLGGADPGPVLAALGARYADRGVTLSFVAGGWSFRTAPDLAPALTRVIESPRRLPRAAMEALAIIAWHQPVTRPEIEEIRGTALSQPTLELLLENALIAPRGRKESPGRPTLWATTPRFLEHFGLASLRDLPRREDLLPDPVLPFGAAPAGATGEGSGPISPEA